jgi:hypothetical protein
VFTIPRAATPESLETTVKGAAYGRDAISSVDPVSYSRRFQRFLRRVFE